MAQVVGLSCELIPGYNFIYDFLAVVNILNNKDGQINWSQPYSEFKYAYVYINLLNKGGYFIDSNELYKLYNFLLKDENKYEVAINNIMPFYSLYMAYILGSKE